ncbi:Fc.00g078900.m01.CDS01 [Cosmosporella sp. VM-42]
MSDANADHVAASKTLSALFSSIGDKIAQHDEDIITTSRRVMRQLVSPLLSQMDINEQTSTPLKLFDNACGSGLFTQEVQGVLPREVLEKSKFLCADNSEGMVSLVKRRVAAEGWVNVETKTLDAMDTGLAENSFSHVGLGLALHLIPNPDAVLGDCKRILKPKGIFGATTFHSDNSFWIPDVRSAFASFPFEAPIPPKIRMQMHDSGDWTDPAWIEKHLKEEGFAEVKVTLNPGTYRMESAEEFVRTFGMMLTWLINTWWSEETREKHPVEEVKELMRKHLEEKYEGEGWEINWLLICMTASVEK